MSGFDSWESYFYDPPHDMVLRNIPGKKNLQELALLEEFAVRLRTQDLHAGDGGYPGYGDVESIRNLHLYLYQDVYPWAGDLRTVNMTKGSTRFADVAEIEPVLTRACELANDPRWHRMDPDDFAFRTAEVYTLFNHAHPFREGNGTTGKEYLRDVVANGPYVLDLEGVDWFAWNRASMTSRVTADPWTAHPSSELVALIGERLSVDVEELQELRGEDDVLAHTRGLLSVLKGMGQVGDDPVVFADKRAVEDQWFRDRVWEKHGRSWGSVVER